MALGGADTLPLAMDLALSGWRPPASVLTVAVALGVALRLVPCVRDPGFEVAWDSQYHERLTRQVVASGRLAEVDPLSNAPAGRSTARHLPVGLYLAGASMHRMLGAVGLRDLRWSLAMLQALAGGLIALPVWLGAVAVFRDRRAAAVAGLVAVFLPAHLARTIGVDFRYDGLGTLLVTAHVALLLAALADARPRHQWLLSLGAALAFVAAMGVWRVSVIVLPPELAVAMVRFACRGPEPASRALWLAMALVGTLGLIPIGYLSEHRFLMSPLWLMVVGFGLIQWLPAFAQGRWTLRLVALSLVVAAAFGWGRLQAAADYAALPALLKAKLGLAPGHDPDAALMLTVVEMQGMSVPGFLSGWEFFSFLGAWFAASPLLLWWLAGRPSLRRVLRLSAAPATLVAVGGAFGICTLLFRRNCVLLAPFLAIVIGGLLVRLGSGVAPEESRVRRGRRTSRIEHQSARLGFAALAISVVVAITSGAVTTVTSVSRLAPNQKAAIEFLRTRTPADAIVMCDWDSGYEIQARAGRATVVDGLLESADNRRRVLDLYAALMDSTSRPLEALCRRYHASWLLLPTSRAIYAMAAVTGDPLADVLARHEGVPRGPLTNHLIVHLIEGDPAYPWLRRALVAGGYAVFEIVPDANLLDLNGVDSRATRPLHGPGR
jgi:asparagine N-glycosylation enzyme membrane subunit Stt3